uniref:Uncharacterized protein n=1 Tax=Timema genevievae TaxID=629358 RepID=A0A7R9JSI1_TIMGE|nr:unnamed protein product [Timema genevievae]
MGGKIQLPALLSWEWGAEKATKSAEVLDQSHCQHGCLNIAMVMALQDSVGKTNKMIKKQEKEDVKKLTDGVVKIKLDVVSGKENVGSHNSSGKAKKITKKKSLNVSDKREERKASKTQQAMIGSTSRSFRPLSKAGANVVKVTGAQKRSASQGKPIQRNKKVKRLCSKNINKKIASSYNKHTDEDQGASKKVTVCTSKETLYKPSDSGKIRHFYHKLSITKTMKKDQLDKYNLDDTSTDSSADSDGNESVTSTSSTRSAASPTSTDDSVYTTSTSGSSIDSCEEDSSPCDCCGESSDNSDDSEEHSFTSSSTSSEENKRVVSSSKNN